MSKNNFQFSLQRLIIFLILIVAAFLRLYRIADYMTFLGDEGRDVLVVYNILHGNLTLLGPTASVGGFFLGPIYYYFMAPFLWLFNYDPVGPAVMVALFGIATVWLVYKIGSEFFDQTTGLMAAVLYSLSPLVIAYSHSSWNPNLMPFFSILTIYTLYQATNKKRSGFFILTGIFLGFLMQLHYLATFVGAIVFIYIILTKIFFKKTILEIVKNYFSIFAGFLLGWSLFLAFEIRHSFPNLRSIINFIFNSGDTGGNENFLTIISDVFFRVFARLVTNFPPPEQILAKMHSNIEIWYSLTISLGVLSTLIFLYKLYQAHRQHDKKINGLILLLTWFFVGLFLFGFYKKSIYDYYFGFMFPLPFLLVSNTLSFLLRKDIYLKLISISILIALVWINLRGLPFRSPPNRQLAQVEEISRFVFQKTEGKPFNFALITIGNSDHAYRYFFKLWGNFPKTIGNTQNDPQRKSVTNQLMVVCERPCFPLGHPLWEVAGFGRAEIAGEWNVSVVKIYRLIHYKGA